MSHENCNCGAQNCSEHSPHKSNCAVYTPDGSQVVVLKAHGGNRSKNLEGIADKIDEMLGEAEVHSEGHDVLHLDRAIARRIKGYMEQLRIIADELHSSRR